MSRRSLVAISAGLNQPSSTRLLADQLIGATTTALKGLGADVDVSVLELRDYARDITNNLVTGFPSEQLKTALDAVASAHGLIAVTPTFRGSFSGLFKSFLDVIDDEALHGTPVLLGATGGTARHSLMLEHAVRPVFVYLRAVVVPTSVFAATDDWAGDVQLAPLRARIERAAGELAAEVIRCERVATPDPFELTTSFDQLLAGG
jgi:FMN reductase